MKAIVVALTLFLLPMLAQAADQPAPAGASGPPALSQAPEHPAKAAEAPEAEGIPTKAQEIFNIGPLPVTNSMLVTWIVALGLILFARQAGRNMKEVPDGAQNFWEWMVEGLYDFLEQIVGPELIKKTFWFFASIFIFIFFTNWFGLVPGVGTMGWGVETSRGFEITRPLLRGGNADLNMTFAMAAIFMVLWFIWAFQSNGIVGFFLHIFGPKGDMTGFLKYFMMVVFFAVGFIEVVSIAVRPISLSFRLFGNVFAGENLMDAMARVIQHPAWLRTLASILVPIPFYFMELLVGLVQAMVFMLLTSIFTGVMCMHEDHDAKAHH